jgi:hypothetical protein
MAQQFTLPVQQGTLKRVEQISADEKAELQKAADAVTKAQADFEAAKSKVATAHKMTRENYMEWSSWYEFDGDFILQRFSFNIVNHVGW